MKDLGILKKDLGKLGNEVDQSIKQCKAMQLEMVDV
jgi:hypothetical protein